MTTTMPTTTTTTTTMPTTTTTTTGKPTANVVVTRSFAMDIKYNDAYNNPSHEVYINVDNAIKTQCKEHIRTLQSAEISEFRSGSTVVDYTITATTFGEGELEAVKVGIFTNLSRIYSMIFDSPTSLPFNPPFLGQKLSLTCGPIPAILNFTDSWTAEWRRNDEIILEDSLHSFAKQAKTATLTVLQFFTTDKGRYECKLKEKNVFKQQSKGEIIYKVLPIIQLKPMTVKIKCEAGKRVLVECSVNSPYMVEFKDLPVAGKGLEIDYEYSIDGCPSPERKFTCQEVNFPSFKKEITLKTSTEDFLCVSESVFGQGVLGDRAPGPCDPNEVGEKIAECQENGTWKVIEENCVLRQIYELLDQSTTLNNNSLAAFLDKLSNVTIEFDEEVAVSPANVNALVDTLNNVADKISSLNILVTEIYMEDILLTVGVLTTDGAKQSWDSLNTKSTTKSSVSSPTRSKIPKANNPSSSLLLSLETITSNLDNNSFEIATSSILLTKTTFKDTFNDDFNSSVEIHIPEADGGIKSITVLTFSSMDNVLPARDEDNSTSNVINGRVVLVKSGGTISNISFAFDVINNALRNPQCVFWNFSLFDGLGGWDGEGCQLILSVNQTVTCTCNHLTSFSILMSPYVPNSPVLDYITYIGVGISMASLVICLIIESIIWRKIRKNNTSYLRHVSIVNIAVSLLIANIWFIIGAAISDEDVKNPPACIAATFFIHFFYLALFFWMLASALLLLYRTISVFGGDLSKHSMLAIGFSLGYGAPLIIAIITIAVTAPSGAYIRDSGVCWLNWETSMALLAFVIPALTIVVINLGILLVVLYKMLRRRSVVDTAQAAEKNALAVIARALAFLTPFFGLTWGLGVGTMTAKEGQRLGVHIAFAFFNSLQGFFILLFGTLLDKKVLTEMALISQTSRSGTRSTSDGTSSSGWGILRNWRRGRDGYNVSSNGDGSYHTNS
ncbi:adhesion G-protein coupled receptor F2 [Scophthalmus maximus]|uniref:adhesion G-protein coupled receptor F2 n=1 Tax=Scophthalmus maximus TaxID=52904 RepID=UPI001FA9412A|nr:adhesion G-protein coupled receptor F2 [Scophthalmus maximus]